MDNMGKNANTYKSEHSEKDIENHLIDNIHEISSGCFWGDIKRFKPQFQIGGIGCRAICDVMIWHNDGTGTVVEVKKYKSLHHLISSIGQIILYGELIHAILGQYPRLVIACDHIPQIVKHIVKLNTPSIKLLELNGNRVEYI